MKIRIPINSERSGTIMTRQETLHKKMSSGYKKSVVDEILKRRDAGLPDAFKVFHRYYRSVNSAWGHEPNPEVFAEQVLKLDRLVKRIKTISPDAVAGTKSPTDLFKATQRVCVKRQRTPVIVKSNAVPHAVESVRRDSRIK